MKRGPLLDIQDLSVEFRTGAGTVRAVEGVSYDIAEGETLAVDGESGCGKSVTALAILGLLSGSGSVTRGRILFRGEDLVRASPERLRAIRGNEIAMIFQEPMSSLNPVFTVGAQIGEVLALHRGLEGEEQRAEVERLLAEVGIPSPERRADEYPHQLSGGMRQRVMIAMALACSPRLLIADEPTTALDVTVQAQILDLLRGLQHRLGMSLLLITHDLGVVAEVAHRVAVLYAGKVVETAEVHDLFDRPRHPYTVGLFRSLPRLAESGARLRPIEGTVPDALHLPPGCRFHPRCPWALPRCRDTEPPLRARGKSENAPHLSACHYVDDHPDADLRTEHEEEPAA